MYRFLSLLFFLFAAIFLFFPRETVSAHGGFEKRAGTVVVYVKQQPLSPLVGEKVQFWLSFRDEGDSSAKNLNDQDLVHWPVQLSVIDTFYGDESKDTILYQKDFITDPNGGFNFEYTFTKENYFDIDLRLKDKKGISQQTGFLIFPRDPAHPSGLASNDAPIYTKAPPFDLDTKKTVTSAYRSFLYLTIVGITGVVLGIAIERVSQVKKWKKSKEDN